AWACCRWRSPPAPVPARSVRSVPACSAAWSWAPCSACSSFPCSSWSCSACSAASARPTSRPSMHRQEVPPMTKPLITSLAMATSLFVAGCSTLQPPLPEAAPSIPAEWPLPATTPVAADGTGTITADIGWRDFFADPRLDELVAQALANNRDLRVAVLNVERARSQYGIQRADRLPSLGAEVSMTRGGGDNLDVSESYSASAGIAGFELDLFGRVHNLSQEIG